MAQAICAFFRNWDRKKQRKNIVVLEKWEEITDGGNLIFCMNEGYAQDDDEIQKIWDAENEQTETDAEGICLVTGERTEISRIHRNIKESQEHSPVAALWFLLMHHHLNLMEKNRVIMHLLENMQNCLHKCPKLLLAQRKYTFPLGDSMIVYWAEEAKLEYQDVLLALLNPVKTTKTKYMHSLKNSEKMNRS